MHLRFVDEEVGTSSWVKCRWDGGGVDVCPEEYGRDQRRGKTVCANRRRRSSGAVGGWNRGKFKMEQKVQGELWTDERRGPRSGGDRDGDQRVVSMDSNRFRGVEGGR